MLVMATVLWFLVVLLTLAVAALVYAVVHCHRQTTASNMFDLTEVSVPCSSADIHCLCKKGNESQKLCFQGNATNGVQVSVPAVRFSRSFSVDGLPTDEDAAETFHLLNMEYGAFRHPGLTDPTLCFRKTSDPKNPVRLCYTPSTATAFLTGPTKIIPEPI
jgi:hypothetical protein